MKKKLFVLLVVVSVLLIGFGIYFSNINCADNKVLSVKLITINEASTLLYSSYPLDDVTKYYSFVKENEQYYYFKVVNSNENKQYLVNKITNEIAFEFYFE